MRAGILDLQAVSMVRSRSENCLEWHRARRPHIGHTLRIQGDSAKCFKNAIWPATYGVPQDASGMAQAPPSSHMGEIFGKNDELRGVIVSYLRMRYLSVIKMARRPVANWGELSI